MRCFRPLVPWSWFLRARLEFPCIIFFVGNSAQHHQSTLQLDFSQGMTLEKFMAPRSAFDAALQGPHSVITVGDTVDNATQIEAATCDRGNESPPLENILDAAIFVDMDNPGEHPMATKVLDKCGGELSVADNLLKDTLKIRLQAMVAPTPNNNPSESAGDDIEAKMWEDLKSRGFRFNAQGGGNNPMAGRWARWLKANPDEQEKYKKITTNTAKADFRREWCKDVFDKWPVTQSTSKKLELIDRNKGVHLALARIAHKEGGGKDGMRAAINIAMKCIEMGEPWVKYDTWAQRPKYMYMETGHEELFTRAWL